MGFLSAYSGTHRVTIPHPDQDYWVELREHLPHGATEKSAAALQAVTMVGNRTMPSPDVFKSRAELVLASVVEWNLDDDNGTVWPVNMQSIRRLPEPVFDRLIQAIETSNAVPAPAERAQFPDEGAGGDPDGHGRAAEHVDVPAGAAALAAAGAEA